MLRRDSAKLGRVSEMLETDKELKRKRKAFDTDEGAVVRGADAGQEDGGAEGAEDGEDGKEDGGGKKRKKKKADKERAREDASTVRSG